MYSNYNKIIKQNNNPLYFYGKKSHSAYDETCIQSFNQNCISFLIFFLIDCHKRGANMFLVKIFEAKIVLVLERTLYKRRANVTLGLTCYIVVCDCLWYALV